MIEWQDWAFVALMELHEIARDREADYLPVRCPRCSRVRLLTHDVEPVCEKCGWRPSLENRPQNRPHGEEP